MRRAVGITLALLVIALIGWTLWRRGGGGSAATARPAAQASSSAPTRAKSGGVAATPEQPKSSAPVERSTLADALNSPTTDIRADLRILADVLDAFRTNFPRDGNPTGSNEEITAALTGRNPLRLALIAPEHRAINAAGQLCDRWSTPFFFHAESGTRMEIRSAGPDRKLWTDDDVTFTP